MASSAFPHLHLDTSFSRHPKLLDLCDDLGDRNAGMYLVRIWSWATGARASPHVTLSLEQIETAAEWRGTRAHLTDALWQHGFIRRHNTGEFALLDLAGVFWRDEGR